MRKTVLLSLGMLLIAGLMGQVAAASEQTRKAEDTAATTPDSHYRDSFNRDPRPFESNGPSAPLTAEEERNKEDFGFSGRDPSRVGGEDPNLNPGD